MSFLAKDWTLGQMNALIKLIGEEQAKKMLRAKDEFEIVWNKYLSLIEVRHLQPKKFSVHEFYPWRAFDPSSPTWVSDNFGSRCRDLNEIDYAGGKLARLRLNGSRSDSQILEEWGNLLVQDFATVIGQIASMVSAQPNGGPGGLLADGHNNIFYCHSPYEGREPSPVVVKWDTRYVKKGTGMWSCHVDLHKEVKSEGDQILSPTW